MLVNTLNYILTADAIDNKFTQGIIILIPKKESPQQLRDYRPITLLNTDYKLFTKVLANRIRCYLPTLIGIGQTCGIPQKKITYNLQAIRDAILHYSAHPFEEAAVVNLDFEKAFDYVKHQYLYAVLHKFKFPDKIINTISRLYLSANSRLLINGFLSKHFPIERSVRQGCPLSACLFVLSLEPFIRYLHRTLEESGNLFTVRAYADDVTLLLRKTSHINTLPQVIKRYEQASDAKVNYTKSCVLPLGAWPENRTVINIPTLNNFKVLGMEIHRDFETLIQLNWTKTVNNVRNTIYRARSRNLNLIQKVWHINLLVLSKIWYLAQVIPFPEKYSQQVERTIGYYIWQGYLYKAARDQLRRPIAQGGLNLIAVSSKSQALLIKHIHQAVNGCGDEQDVDFWKHAATHNLPVQLRRILHTTVTLPPDTYNTEPNKLSRSIYNFLMSKNTKDPSIMVKYPNENWQAIWKTFTTPYILTDWKVQAYKLINELIPTEEKKFRHNLSSSPMCPTCNNIDTQRHRLLSCHNAKPIWQWTFKTLQNTLPEMTVSNFYSLVLKLHVCSKRHQFGQIWLTMGYIHYMMTSSNKNLDNFRHQLTQAKHQLRKFNTERSSRYAQQLLKFDI